MPAHDEGWSEWPHCGPHIADQRIPRVQGGPSSRLNCEWSELRYGRAGALPAKSHLNRGRFARMVRASESSAWKSVKNNGAVPKRRRPHSYWICHRICALGPAGNSGNPHRKCDSRFPPGIPVLSRSPVPTSPAAEYGPVHCSRLADAAAYAGSARGALNPSFSKRSAIFCAMAWPWPLSTSAMMEPPKPPPVIRAP